LLKEMQTLGLNLWTDTEATLFLQVGQSSYDLTTANAANTYYETTTTAATTAGATSFLATSVTNIQDGDIIGIIQNNNNLFWSTVNGTPSGLTVNLDDAITLATLSGAVVYNYRPSTSTAPALIPVSRIISVRRKEGTDYETPIRFESRSSYFNQPNKTQTGTPIQAYYSRQDRAGESAGTMYVWNTPSSSVPVINFTYERKVQVMVNTTDTLDLPDYAHEYVIYNLAERLILKFGCGAERAQLIYAGAKKTKDAILAYGTEMYPIQVSLARS
jgi:hypothetical protein